MQQFTSVRAFAGRGLEGDRYWFRIGSWSKPGVRVNRQVSFIAIEDIREANQSLEKQFLPEDTRRNILTEGVDLNSLVNKQLLVGDVLMVGIKRCDSCARPSALADKPFFAKTFVDRGGLIAEVLNDGVISVGDEIFEFVEEKGGSIYAARNHGHT
ncbi:MAG: hypothetical protein A3K06_02610 [Candidatus Doudnabacteria bacterium RIFCSPHIGHO2_01_52_17]|uniref:MOSC domain-containing protein n=1 Tax=Candidatus Doudnabacteria bacterium RIFCSPHIGHO2_01_52_17 TaxID=1817820 RepID=A0A1F5NA94_9BACT|nr:MAG: hypothetical protein A3K06_02610 [Candidatus Doudnabacteria bacterium RIFCSPHIGHO2_01_52_17]